MLLLSAVVFRSFLAFFSFNPLQWSCNSRSLIKTKTGCRPFLLIQVDLLVDWKTLPVHLITHARKIKSKSHPTLPESTLSNLYHEKATFNGAGNEIWTRDSKLGKLVLYHWVMPALQETQKYYKIYAMSMFFNINFDGFLKSPTSALGCIPGHCGVR